MDNRIYIFICIEKSMRYAVYFTRQRLILGFFYKMMRSECIASHLKNDRSVNVVWFSPFS